MADLVPRSMWPFPSQRIASFIDDLDDFLPVTQTDTSSTLSISEDDKHIHLEVAMPGVDPDDIEVTFDKGAVWIRGQAKEEKKDKNRKYYRKAASAFSYRVTVPGDINPNAKPEAESKNGIVMVTFPKKASTVPQKIAIRKGSSNGSSRHKKPEKRNIAI